MRRFRLCGVAALSIFVVGCVPAGPNFGSGFGGGAGRSSVNPNGIYGDELYDLFIGASAFIEWNDDYSECGFFDRNGDYEFDAYFRERGAYVFDYGDVAGWSVSGDVLCIAGDCYTAEWASDDSIYLVDSASGYSGYAELFDGPGYFYQDSCGIVF